MVIDHGKVVYAEKEPGAGEVTVSSTEDEAVLFSLQRLILLCLGVGSGGSTVQALERQHGLPMIPDHR